MLVFYFLFLTLKTWKFAEAGVVNSNGLKYDPTNYLNSKGSSKDVSTARIISQDPFIISLGIQDKEIEPNRSRKKIPVKKRNRTKRETEEKLKRSKRCHHRSEKYGQRKRDLRLFAKKPASTNDSAPDPEIVTSQFHPPDTYEEKPNSTTECIIKITDDETLDELIEEIRTLKEKLKDLLILVANFTMSEKEPSSQTENRSDENEKFSTEALEDEDDEFESQSQTRSEINKSTEDIQDNEVELEAGPKNETQKSSTEDFQDEDELKTGAQSKNEKSTEDVDSEDLADLSDDKSILKDKTNLVNETDDEIDKIPSHATVDIPDAIFQKWKNSPLLDLLDAPEKIPYEYKLLDDPEKEESSEAQKFLQGKIKYLQDILDSEDLKSRKKRDLTSGENRKKRCARDRVASTHTKERFRSRQWEDELKSKRAQSKCQCSGCQKSKSEDPDSFEMSDEYVDNFLDDNPETLLSWSKKGANSDPFVDDLEVYRDKAKKILKNAQDILKRIKETEEKMKPYDDYLEADWGRHEKEETPKNNDDDVEDLVYELIKKVGKRLKDKKRRLEGESASFEFDTSSKSASAEDEDEEDEDDDANGSENLEAVQTSSENFETSQTNSSTTTASPMSTLKGTDVMKDHRDHDILEAKNNSNENGTEEVSLPENLPVDNNDNLQASKLGLESTDSVEKLMDDFQDGKLDNKDMKTIQEMDGEKIKTLINQIDEHEAGEGEDGGCTEPVNDCEQTCPCADKADDVDKYEIMKSFLLWIKEMHLYNTLDNYPKIKSAYD